MTVIGLVSRSRIEAEVQLLRDVDALLDVGPYGPLALGAGLVGDELHAQDLGSSVAHLVGAAHELDAAALAAATGVDLGLDDHHGESS
jgi:hypothetical protein